MSASELRKISSSASETAYNIALIEVTNDLHEAAKKGLSSITCLYAISERLKDELSRNGYTVREYVSGPNESATDISW